MIGLAQYINKIEAELSHITPLKEPIGVYEPIRYILALGGKRIRPLLCMLSAELFVTEEPKDPKTVLYPALAIELFHNYTLIHDDIMDEAPLRRGKETVHKKWNVNTAILSGDLMSILAYDLLLYAPNEQLKEVIAVFNHGAKIVCEGQQMDMDFEQRTFVQLDEYLTMIGAKTGALLGTAMAIGALCAGQGTEQANILYECGYNLGVAFQLQDDYLDGFGNSIQTGKQLGGDILSGKKTYPYLYTIQQKDFKDSIMELYQSNSPDKISHALNLYEQSGAKDALLHEMNIRYQDGLRAISQIKGNLPAQTKLISLIESLLVRNS